MPIKVCHMTSTHFEKDQRIFYKECISLAKHGYKVFLVERGSNELLNGIRIIGTGEEKTSRYYRLLVRPFKIYQLAKKVDADIYHFHDMELIPFGLKLKKRGKKVIFDYHEDYASRFSDSDALKGPPILKTLLGKLYQAYEKHAIKQFDAMISVTPHICKRLLKYNPLTVMITNYPLIQSEAWTQNWTYNTNSDYFAFAGQISDTYQLSFITKTFQNIPNVKLKMCGPERKSGDINKIEQCDCKNKIEYIGQLPYMEIPAFLSKSRASFVMLEYGNNTGGKMGSLGNNKLFESMLCGVPIICTDFILWKKIVNKYQCGICVNPSNQKELYDAIKFILENPGQAQKMGINGRNAVKTKFNWDIEEKKLIQLYKKILYKERY